MTTQRLLLGCVFAPFLGLFGTFLVLWCGGGTPTSIPCTCQLILGWNQHKKVERTFQKPFKTFQTCDKKRKKVLMCGLRRPKKLYYNVYGNVIRVLSKFKVDMNF